MSFEEVARMISNKISSYEQTMKQREALTKAMDRDLVDIKTLFQSMCSSIVAMKIPSGSSVRSFPIVTSSRQLTKTDFQKQLESQLSFAYLQSSLTEHFPSMEKMRSLFLLSLFNNKYDLGQNKDPCVNFLPFLNEGNLFTYNSISSIFNTLKCRCCFC